MSAPTIEPLVVPLRRDETGSIRVGKTRVLLELVVREFRRGATSEAIVLAYDSLELKDEHGAARGRMAWLSSRQDGQFV